MYLLRRRIVAVLLASCWIATAAAQAEKVYVTRTGSKYHRATCSSLAKSKIEMSLSDAAKRYEACRNCRPPVPAWTASSVTVTPEPAKPPVTKAAQVASGRCQATTKKGTQCSRKPQAGRTYCWQH